MPIGEIREILASLPFTYVVLSGLLAVFVIGGAGVFVLIALQGLPRALRDFNTWRLDRKGVLSE